MRIRLVCPTKKSNGGVYRVPTNCAPVNVASTRGSSPSSRAYAATRAAASR